MSKEQKNGVLVALLIVLGVVTIGYAALNTTLKINGTTKIKSANWDVHFATVAVTDGSATASVPAAVQPGSTEVKFTVDLNKPGDFYEFTVDVVNAGSIDAKLNAIPTISGVSDAQDVYVNYTVTKENGGSYVGFGSNDALNHGATQKIKVRVEFDRDITKDQLPDSEQTLSLVFSADYVQA